MASSAPASTHRADIDGLRAVAIVPVVLYHAELIPGGYLGVDIFFVISGFLISSILLREMASGPFSLAAFYERRARRILPAFFVMLAVSTAVATRTFLPGEFTSYAKSAFAATLFASNVWFAGDAGYFDGLAQTKPLLHTWSLAVEEQFYIVFPLLLWAGYRWMPRRVPEVLVVLLLASAAAAVWAATASPTAGFYLVPFRGWELLLGALLSVWQPRTGPYIREMAGVAGALLILWSLSRAQTDWAPLGLPALGPCLGAALLIHAGGAGRPWVNRLLANRPVAYIGLISYSLYLWHWPLLVYAERLSGTGWFAGAGLLVVVATVPIAAASWRWIEQPFRSRQRFARRAVFSQAALASVVTMTFCGAVVASGGWASRLPENLRLLDTLSELRDPTMKSCMGEGSRWVEPRTSCRFGAEDATPSWAVWGDSHAAAMIAGLAAVAERHGDAVRLFSFAGCPPLIGVRLQYKPESSCRQFNRLVLDELTARSEIRTVALVARHSMFVFGLSGRFGPAERDDLGMVIADPATGSGDVEVRKRIYAGQLEATVRTLLRLGKRVVLVYPIPETGRVVPLWLADTLRAGGRPHDLGVPFDEFARRHAFTFGMLDELSRLAGVVRVYPHFRLCDGAQCKVYAADRPLYADDDHLSVPGARYIAPIFEPMFANAAAS